MVFAINESDIKDINATDYFTLLVDGTKDKNKNEIISIAARYIKDGKPCETLLAFVKCDSACADYLTDLILEQITSFGLNPSKIISQCYDGANVMSGQYGGIQTVLQNKLYRSIPHCFNHRLNLVVIASIEKIMKVHIFFGQLRSVYNFLSRWKVKLLYEESHISRLIDTRWSGHKKQWIQF